MPKKIKAIFTILLSYLGVQYFNDASLAVSPKIGFREGIGPALMSLSSSEIQELVDKGVIFLDASSGQIYLNDEFEKNLRKLDFVEARESEDSSRCGGW